jgi:glucokinase
MRILSGDIGGTNTRLMVWTNESGALRPVGSPLKFKNVDFESLDAILAKCSDQCAAITDACFGIAGPVEGRSVRLTNIAHWPEVHADQIAQRLKIAEKHRVNLINDMPAHAASLSSIEMNEPGELVAIRKGTTRPTGTQIIIAPGTGLGIGMLVYDAHSKLHRPTPTEAGHADMTIRDEASWRLVQSAHKAIGESLITREHLLSGPGLRLIYACLANPSAPDLQAAPKGETLTDPNNADPIALKTLDIFARMLGELCGNAALQYLSTGGIYLAGNIANSLKSRILSPRFQNGFEQSGPSQMKALLASIPVKLVTYEETGLLGAATYATWAAARKV